MPFFQAFVQYLLYVHDPGNSKDASKIVNELIV